MTDSDLVLPVTSVVFSGLLDACADSTGNLGSLPAASRRSSDHAATPPCIRDSDKPSDKVIRKCRWVGAPLRRAPRSIDGTRGDVYIEGTS